MRWEVVLVVVSWSVGRYNSFVIGWRGARRGDSLAAAERGETGDRGSVDFVQHGIDTRRRIRDTFFQQKLVSQAPEWKKLVEHKKTIQQMHLKDLILDEARCAMCRLEYDGIFLDYSRQQVTGTTMKLLMELARKQNLREKIDAMKRGELVNNTEKRAVLHTALRADRNDEIILDGVDVVKQVHNVLDNIKHFSEKVRKGEIRGYTGKLFASLIVVGIGGSYLGPDFLHEALKTEEEGCEISQGFTLRFLSNVDPVDVKRTCEELDPETTMVIIVSKSFTTAETMLNARTMRQWLWSGMEKVPEVIEMHMVACASLSVKDKVLDFGIREDRLFEFWDWVGGRYSVCSAAGALPISIKFGYDLFEKFLHGARAMDKHFYEEEFSKNIPVIMGLLGVWNLSFLGYKTRTTLPYAEALLRLPAHIQQLAMESNGKHVTTFGVEVDYDVGEIDFGEPGTNGQHSFFQLLHMGQPVPCEFLGFIESQNHLHVEGEPLSSHDELMANFFAQPDALATGKVPEELVKEGCPRDLIPHRTFHGNRPSLSLLFPKLTAYTIGQILALYEHRTAVQGFIWDINSFDQWGVELGKQLAKDIRNKMESYRSQSHLPQDLNPSTTYLLKRYLKAKEE